MNNTQSSRQSGKKAVVSLKKFLFFPVGTLNCALSVDVVQKVYQNTKIYSSGLNELGLAHFGDFDVPVIDLHRRIFHTTVASGAGVKSYVILTVNSAGERFGVLVPHSPSLIDIPLSSIRVLPDSYRRRDSLDIASHVALLSDQESQITVFILEADSLIPPLTLKT